jgi:hypothetical protein
MISRSSEVTGKAPVPVPLPCKDVAADRDLPSREMVSVFSSLEANALLMLVLVSLISISKF